MFSTVKAAPQSGSKWGCERWTVSSMSCGYILTPWKMIRSLIRPVMNSSPSFKNPRSPVRRNGPSPVSFKKARKVACVASGRPQYPLATLGPWTQIFTDLIGWSAGHGFRIGNDNRLIGERFAAADQRANAFFFGIRVGDLIVGQCRTVDPANHRRILGVSAGNNERCFGHAETRIKRLPPEAATGKRLAERLDGLLAHRLGAVERQEPVAQIQSGLLFGRDLPHAQIVGEIGPAAGRRAETRDRRQPSVGLLQKRHRRHQNVAPAHVQRLQYAADQAHVVVAGKPKHP